MKVIIAGSRSVKKLATVEKAINLALASKPRLHIDEVVSGTARGVDQLGEEFADKHSITIKRFPADWDTHGRSAGYKRNVVMARYADALIAIWDGKSRGTAHMIDIAREHNLLTVLIKVK